MLQARNAHVSLAYRPGKRPRLYTVNRSPPKISRAHNMRVHAWGAGHTLAEAIHGDTWALDARAAMLNLKVDELNNYIYSNVDHAWLATCAPERLFALREVCELLSTDVGSALELVNTEPGLLDTPASALAANIRGIQSLLELPRPAIVQLLFTAPSLMLAGPSAIELQVQRVAWGLGLSAAGPDAPRLLQVLPALGTQALLDQQLAVQKLSPFISALQLQPGDALTLLQAEVLTGHDLQELLEPSNLNSLSRQWRSLVDEVKVPLSELMVALAAQIPRSDARYLVGSCQLLRSDIVALQTASQLNHSTACRMLLAAPRLAKVPASFWQLLMQYILFLVPQWRQQLQKMPPADAGILLARLFDRTGADVDDSVSVSHDESLFDTADIDYNQELAALEALLDQGVQAPRFALPGRVRAGRVWRLIYMCNPRLAAAQQAHAASTTSAWVGSWSRMFNLQMPGALLNQMQRQGALSCDLSEAPAAGGSRQSVAVSAESIEGLCEVVLADVVEFCEWHPGYVHWLHNTAFELEWAHSKAVADIATWDP